MNITVFTGAGVSQESGINTFRDIKDGLWYNHNVEDVATLRGWRKDRKVVLDFHNHIREGLKDKLPNEAHKTIAEWEKDHNVTVVTQNVDNLHEMAGSTNVLHLHGELNKCRSTLTDEIFPMEGDTLNVGDKCPEGSQLRPHTVLFDEYPYNIEETVNALTVSDMLIIVGTSLEISYTIPLLTQSLNEDAKVYYIDPQPNTYIDVLFNDITYVSEKATIGVKSLKF